MKIRLMGTETECENAAKTIATVMTVNETSQFYPNQGNSVLGRVYLDAELRQPTR